MTREWRSLGAIVCGLALTFLVLETAACGQSVAVSRTPSAASPSPSPTAAPESPSAVSSLQVFGENNCVNPPSTAARTPPLHDAFGSVVELPTGWTSIPLGASETESLALDAPGDYAYVPMRIGALALIGRWPTGTDPEVVLKDWYEPVANGNPEFAVTVVGKVTRCTVGSADASYFEYSAKNSQAVAAALPASPQGMHGYMVVFLHGNAAFGIRLEGTGGVDPRAVAAAKEILGSWSWTKPVQTPSA